MFHEDQTKFEFDYESGSSSSYLVLKTDTGSEIMNYQIEMIASNPCGSILPIEKRQINGKVNLYYNITSLSTLEHYLKRKTLNRKDFISILRDIIKVISDSRKYFLNENSFLIDIKYIFINPATSEIALIYVPLKVHDDINNNYKAFVFNIILNTANFDERSGGSVIPHILNYLKNDSFNLASFDKFLGELAGKAQLQQSKVQHQRQAAEVEIPRAAEPSVKQLKGKTEGGDNKAIKKVYKKNNLLIAGLGQVLMVVSITLLLQILPGMNPEDRVSTAVGAAIILGALDFLLLRRLLDKRLMVDVPKQMHEAALQSKINMSKREICSKPAESELYTHVSADIAIQSAQNNMDTIVLDDSTPCSKPAYLKSTGEGIVEKIMINKQSFIFGRLKDHVDYISQNNAVGKIHAELVMRDGQYFIKDLNSKNGTRINGERINSNMEYEIKNSDRVSFADSEYIFVIE